MREALEYRGYTIERHRARWRVRLRLDGRVVRISRQSSDEVKRALDDVLDRETVLRRRDRARSDVRQLGPGHVTVEEMCCEWFRWKTEDPTCPEPIRGRTRRDYRRCIERFIVPALGPRDAATLASDDLRGFLMECSSRHAARVSRTILNQAFRWGMTRRGGGDALLAREQNPCDGIGVVRRGPRDGRNRKGTGVRAITDQQVPELWEIEKMLAWCLETGRHVWWLWVFLTSKLGLRPSEACALRVEDFDLDGRTVTISRAVPDREDPDDWYTKTATSDRTLPLSENDVEKIAPLLPEDTGERFVFGRPAPETGWFFSARARGGGRPQRTSTYTPCWPPDAPNREMRRMRRALGLSERYTPYSLRHFVATTLINEGRPEVQVAKYLGTSVDMLQKTYANHLRRNEQEAIAETMGDLF